MAKAKKAKKKAKKAKEATPYLRRLVEDERVHGHVRDAATGIKHAYGRVSSQRGKATEDKRLYGDLREAATSVRKAALAVRRPPEKKRGGRTLVLVGLAGAGIVVAVKGGAREKLQAKLSGDADQRTSGGAADSGAEESSAAPSTERMAEPVVDDPYRGR